MSEADVKALVTAALLHEVVNVEMPVGESASTADCCDIMKRAYPNPLCCEGKAQQRIGRGTPL
jgi:predicted HD phosphohydrolase